MDMSLNGPGYDSDRQCVKCTAGRFSTGTQVRDLGVHRAYLRVVWVKHIDLVPLKSHRRRTSATHHGEADNRDHDDPDLNRDDHASGGERVLRVPARLRPERSDP